MRAEELTVEVKAKLTVSDETAKRCLRLLEMWWNDNPAADIIKEIEKEKDGTSTNCGLCAEARQALSLRPRTNREVIKIAE